MFPYPGFDFIEPFTGSSSNRPGGFAGASSRMQFYQKQARHFDSLRAVSLGGLKVVPFAPRGRLTRNVEARQAPETYADSAYLHQVILHLRKARMEKGLSLANVTKRARLKRGVVERAERNGTFPTTREFKAWTAALGLQWDDVWTAALPKIAEFPEPRKRQG